MNLSIVFNLLGYFLVFLGLAQLAPLVWAIVYREPEVVPFLISITLSIVVGLLLRTVTRRGGDISIKESFALVTCSWLTAALFGALPFYLSGVLPSFMDAFFEAMSGFTTTGATVIKDIEVLSYGVLFWRSFTHWLGGMGIIALFVAIMPQLGVGGMNLLKAEVPGPTTERIVPRVAETAKILWLIYVFISFFEVILLLLSGLSLFDSLTHTFATMATGGFSTRNLSVGGFHNPRAEIIIIFFMFIAGGNFSLYYRVFKKDYTVLMKDEEFRFYIQLLVISIIITTTYLFLFQYEGFFFSIRKSTFQVLSIITTTGFTTSDFDTWPHLIRGILLFLMFVGGCGGSTAGSVKQIRILILLKYCYRELYKMVHPKAVIPVKINQQPIPDQVITSILAFVFLYMMIFVLGSLVLTGFGIDLISSFSAVAATLGNVGPGLGLVGPLQNYSVIPGAGKLLLTVMMLLGRLEIYTVLVLIMPEFRSYRFSFHR